MGVEAGGARHGAPSIPGPRDHDLVSFAFQGTWTGQGGGGVGACVQSNNPDSTYASFTNKLYEFKQIL